MSDDDGEFGKWSRISKYIEDMSDADLLWHRAQAADRYFAALRSRDDDEMTAHHRRVLAQMATEARKRGIWLPAIADQVTLTEWGIPVGSEK